MKKTNINIRVSKEEKEQIQVEAKKLGQVIGFKVTVSTFFMWLFGQHLKKEG